MSAVDERITRLCNEALDQALRGQIAHLFEVWMKDDDGQPERAKAGAQKAIAAFRQAVQAIDDVAAD